MIQQHLHFKNNPNPYVHNILHYELSLINHIPWGKNNISISPVKLSPKISRMPLYNAPPQPQPQPSIFHINTLSWLWRYKFANVLLIFLFLFIAQSTVFRRSSQIRTSIYLLPTPHVSTKTLFYIFVDMSQRVLLHNAPKFHLLLCSLRLLLRWGPVNYVNAPTGRLKPIWLLPRRFFATINSYIPQLLKFHRYFTVEGALVAQRWPFMPIPTKAEISLLLCLWREMSVNG